MKIIFIRHLKVDFKWDRMYNSDGFDRACQMYDSCKIIRSVQHVLYRGTIYTSNQDRTGETAKELFGDGIKIIKTDLLNEVPLKSFTTLPIKLPTLLWMIIGRIQWYFNDTNQTETRSTSRNRIIEFLDSIQAENQDCTIVGHGFYFTEFVKELKRRGARGYMGRRMKNGEKREFIL